MMMIFYQLKGTSVTANLMPLPKNYDGPTSSSSIIHIVVAGTQCSQPIRIVYLNLGIPRVQPG